MELRTPEPPEDDADAASGGEGEGEVGQGRGGDRRSASAEPQPTNTAQSGSNHDLSNGGLQSCTSSGVVVGEEEGTLTLPSRPVAVAGSIGSLTGADTESAAAAFAQAIGGGKAEEGQGGQKGGPQQQQGADLPSVPATESRDTAAPANMSVSSSPSSPPPAHRHDSELVLVRQDTSAPAVGAEGDSTVPVSECDLFRAQTPSSSSATPAPVGAGAGDGAGGAQHVPAVPVVVAAEKTADRGQERQGQLSRAEPTRSAQGAEDEEKEEGSSDGGASSALAAPASNDGSNASVGGRGGAATPTLSTSTTASVSVSEQERESRGRNTDTDTEAVSIPMGHHHHHRAPTERRGRARAKAGQEPYMLWKGVKYTAAVECFRRLPKVQWAVEKVTDTFVRVPSICLCVSK